MGVAAPAAGPPLLLARLAVAKSLTQSRPQRAIQLKVAQKEELIAVQDLPPGAQSVEQVQRLGLPHLHCIAPNMLCMLH